MTIEQRIKLAQERAKAKAIEMAKLQLSVWNENIEKSWSEQGENPAEVKAKFEREAKGIFE